MIFGYPALWLHLFTILILGMLGGMVITAIVVRLLMSRFAGYSLAARSNLLWLFALFPLIAGGTAVVLSFMPEWFPASDSWLAGIIHWHHAYLFSPTSWHGVFLALSLLSIFAVLAVGAWRVWVQSCKYSLLTSLSESREGGFAELDADVPMAFVAGLLSPKAFITRGLSSSISEQERLIISLHEQAHIARHDPLWKSLFTLLVGAYPSPVRRFLQAELELVQEQRADQWVLSRYPNPSAIAQSLLNVEKLAARFRQQQPCRASCHFAAHAVQRRIMHLLGPADHRSLSVVLVGVVVVVAALCSAASVDLVHHFLETLFLH